MFFSDKGCDMIKKVSLIMYGGGNNTTFMLGISSDTENSDNNTYVSKLTEIPGINVRDIQCISPGWTHTVVVMKNGDVLAAGWANRVLGSENSATYKIFIKVDVCEEEVTWAAAGNDFTLYQTKSGRVVLCHKDFSEKIEIQLPSRAVSVFGGRFYGSIIDEDGGVYFIDIKDPRKAPYPIYFDAPAVEIVCSDDFKVVLLSDGRVFGNGRLNDDKETFIQVPSLSSHKVTRISGCDYSCLALSEDGSVFSYGCNNCGQLGIDSTINNYKNFTRIEIPGDKKIKDIACSSHSLILSREGKLFGCGWNKYKQLFHDSVSDNVPKVVKIDVAPRFNNIFAGNVHSIVISVFNLPINPAKAMFMSSTLSIRSEIRQLDAQFSELKSLINQKNEETRRQSSRENEELSRTLVLKCEMIHNLEGMMSSANDKINELAIQINQIDRKNSESLNQLHRENEELKLMIKQKDEKINQLANEMQASNNKIQNMMENYQHKMNSLLYSISEIGLNIVGPE